MAVESLLLELQSNARSGMVEDMGWQGLQEWWNILCRGKDMASTYRLCPHSRTWGIFNFGPEIIQCRETNMWRHKNNWIGVLDNYKLRSNYKRKTVGLIYWHRMD